MSVKVFEVDQGGPDWHQLRSGCITASMFTVARTKLKSGPNKGDYSAAAKTYAFRLAIERISGDPLDEGFETWQQRRGHELEPEARLLHEERIEMLIEHAGFVQTEDGWFGASADGLINTDGGSEYKCLVAPDELQKIILEDDISKFTDQVQGCLWLTGRKWWHFCLYCPALKSIGKELIIKEIQRDDDYIEAMEADLLEFRKLVSLNEEKLRAAA